MKFDQKVIEKTGFVIIFLTALLIRFVNLGNLPLSDAEASIALDSLKLLSDNANQYASNVLLSNFIAAFIYIFGNSGFVVRFFPALIGTLMVISPFLFHDYLKRNLIYILSVWIAIDPLFIALSRQINSSILCVLVLTLLVYFVLKNKSIPVGIFSGLLLLCGSSFWYGFIPIIIIYLINSLNKNRIYDFNLMIKLDLKRVIISFVFTILIIGTFGFSFPSQFGGIAQGAIDYFAGWGISTGKSLLNILRAIFIYEFPVIGFALLGLLTHKINYNKLVGILAIDLLMNVFLLFVYPSRLLEFSIWLLLPLIIFASFFISNFINISKMDIKLVSLISGIGFVILGFLTLILMNLFTNTFSSNPNPISKTLMIVAGVVLVLFAIFLIGWSLSWKIAGKSILMVSIVYFGIYTLSAGLNSTGLRLPFANEMLYLQPVPVSEDLIINTIENYSEWYHGNKSFGQIQVVNIDFPSLKWALRNFENVEHVKNFSINSNPEFIITSLDQTISMTESYKGQDFEWYSTPAWDLFIPNEWANWLLSRRVPNNLMQQNGLILWVRNDLFPGNLTQ